MKKPFCTYLLIVSLLAPVIATTCYYLLENDYCIEQSDNADEEEEKELIENFKELKVYQIHNTDNFHQYVTFKKSFIFNVIIYNSFCKRLDTPPPELC